MLKTHNCGELRREHTGQQVTLAGWVHRWRDQGGLIFWDLRDRWGLTQVTINQQTAPEVHAAGKDVRAEWVVQVTGTVIRRPAGMENPDLATGDIEVEVSDLTVLNQAKTPPFYINKDEKTEELLRMRYRYLDLRRPKMQRNLVLRHSAMRFIRNYLSDRGFMEIETPILFKTTPEGARDYLVPSRVHPGKFYALPQSPQQLKQLLMVAGYERYFQIARCFRDEDQRGDRQPEFTQLDLEMSFIQREDILTLIEGLMTDLIEQVTDLELVFKPFPRLTHAESLARYGTDKPDLRYGMEIVDVSDIAGESSFRVFADNVKDGKPVRGICVPGCGAYSRKQLGELEEMAKTAGAKGLSFLAVEASAEEPVRSSIAKFFTSDQLLAVLRRFAAKPGDLILLASDTPKTVCTVLDALRREMAERLGLADPTKMAFCWVLDFPLFEWNADENRWDPSHHLFTAPMWEDVHFLDTDPGQARGQQYDLSLNGNEVAGGSIRIHRREVQEKVFGLIGLEMEVARERFGHMLEAFEFGTPPHGGIASGLDRLVMILAGEPNIREVIAFPKSQNAADLMAGAPSEAESSQLEELHIRLVVD
jgi:aspartyl-tRNA synthetase